MTALDLPPRLRAPSVAHPALLTLFAIVAVLAIVTTFDGPGRGGSIMVANAASSVDPSSDPSAPPDPSQSPATTPATTPTTIQTPPTQPSSSPAVTPGVTPAQTPGNTPGSTPAHTPGNPQSATLTLTPATGPPTATFTATYTLTGGTCTYTEVAFDWDGQPIGAPVAIDPGTCSASLEIHGTPPPNGPGTHTLTAVACDDGSCDPGTRATATFVVVPPTPPSLTLVPSSGRVGTAFRATYATNGAGCGYTHATFSWDGSPLGGPVPLTGACTAVLNVPSAPAPNAPGSHLLVATACAGPSCDPATSATAAYVVLAPPPTARRTATPTATPTRTPTRRPTATPTDGTPDGPSARPSEAPSGAPSGAPSVGPSDLPSGGPSASPGGIASGDPGAPSSGPGPTGGVLEETSPPDASASPVAAAPAEPRPAPSGNPFVPDLATFVGGPGTIDPAVVTTNVLLAALIVFLFALTAEIFNSTMDANRAEIHGWWVRLGAAPAAFLARFTVTGTNFTHLSGAGRFGSIARVLAVLGLSGLIYGFLSPDFGPNPESLILFIALVVGLGFITYYSEGTSSRLAKRRFRASASIRLYGTAVVVAVVAVILSRALAFQPGLIYGFIASAVIIAPIALAKRDDAFLILIPAFGLMVVSVLAWLLLGPVRAIAANGEPLPALVQTILAMIVIGGLEGLVVTMIPLRFLDGATVKSWNRWVWAGWFGFVIFLWWQLLFNQDAAYAAAFQQPNVQVVVVTLGAFMLTTGGLWSYFRFRSARDQADG